MKKYIMIIVVMISIMMMFTACGGNTGSNERNDTVDTQVENPTGAQNKDKNATQNDSYPLPNDNREEPSDSESQLDDNKSKNEEEKGEQTEMKMNVQIGDYSFTATLENNVAVNELLDMMKEGPVTIEMDDYAGFEKVGSLGRSLTTSNSQTTTAAGDIVLYNGNNIVMFYGSNSWSYTRIGKIDDLSDWKKALGSGSTTAVFTIKE